MLEVRVDTQRLREERKLSQSELAARAGMRRDTVSALERGKTRGIQFDTLARLCEALACEPGDLLILTEIEPPLMLGGHDEDDIVRARLATPGRRIDGPSFLQALLDEEAHAARP
jgi:putative transcriptional regulator